MHSYDLTLRHPKMQIKNHQTNPHIISILPDIKAYIIHSQTKLVPIITTTNYQLISPSSTSTLVGTVKSSSSKSSDFMNRPNFSRGLRNLDFISIPHVMFCLNSSVFRMYQLQEQFSLSSSFISSVLSRSTVFLTYKTSRGLSTIVKLKYLIQINKVPCK